jgi:hypothetical protein
VAVRERATPVAEEQLRRQVACWPRAGPLKKSLVLRWLDMPAHIPSGHPLEAAIDGTDRFGLSNH